MNQVMLILAQRKMEIAQARLAEAIAFHSFALVAPEGAEKYKWDYNHYKVKNGKHNFSLFTTSEKKFGLVKRMLKENEWKTNEVEDEYDVDLFATKEDVRLVVTGKFKRKSK